MVRKAAPTTTGSPAAPEESGAAGSREAGERARYPLSWLGHLVGSRLRRPAALRPSTTEFRQLPHGVLTLDARLRIQVCTARFCDLLALTRAPLLGEAAASAFAGVVPPISLPAGDNAPARRHPGPGGQAVVLRWTPLADGGWLCIADPEDSTLAHSLLSPHWPQGTAAPLLPDWVAFEARLRAMLANAADGPVAVHKLDFDRFKQTGEALGRVVRDDILREAARRLRAALREDDLLAHLGGDRFAILPAGPTSPDAAETLARRLIEVLGHPYTTPAGQVTLTASAGTALSEPADRDPEHVLQQARLALEAAKAEGRAHWRRFDHAMEAAARDRAALEADLREALNGARFQLVYQPLVSLGMRRVVGLEALLRWHHPVRGAVPPDRFIPLAEELGLIGPLGEWVLRTACRTATLWPASVRVAVNLSPAQFTEPGLLEMIERTLAETGLPAERLELEITEGVLLANKGDTLALLHALRAQGVGIAMDDFGTGYSSLSYLRRFPFDKLKIDRSFIAGIGESEESRAIVRAIAALGHGLGMITTAEGVETREQLQCVLEEGCAEVQGYFFSPPRTAEEVPRLLAEILRSRAG